MRNDKKLYAGEIILLGVLVAAAIISAHDQPPVKVILEGCCNDCHKNCTVHADTQNTKGAAVVVEVVVHGGGAASSSNGGASSSSSGNIIDKIVIPSTSSQTKEEPTPVGSTSTQTPSEPSSAESTPTQTPSEPLKTESTPAQTPSEPLKTESTPAQTPTEPSTDKSTSVNATKVETPNEPTPVNSTNENTTIEPPPIQPAPNNPTNDKSTAAESQVTKQTPAKVGESIKVLCQGALYKDACESMLANGAASKGSTEAVIKSGASVALDDVTKVLTLTDTLVPMIKNAKKPEMAQSAVDDCKEMFQSAMEKLKIFMSEFVDRKSFATPCQTFKFRLWLSDVVTFTDTCMDALGEAEAPDFQNVLKGSVVNTTEITMSILDVFTGLTQTLKDNDGELNPAKISDKLKNLGVGGGKVGSQRRLLEGPNEMIGDDGIPRWLSEVDRELLNLGNRRKEPKRASAKPKVNSGKAKANKMVPKPVVPKAVDSKKAKANKVVPKPVAPKAVNSRKARAKKAVPKPVAPKPVVPSTVIPNRVTPNAVVAQDGSGQFKTINDALKAYDPTKTKLRPGTKYVIYVKAGTYHEYILIGSEKPNIFMYGDGPTKTIISGNKSFRDGVVTTKTATFVAQSANFFARDMAFENTAGAEGHQAVALRANNEQQVYLNCHFNGYQDTLYTQGGSQFFRDCLISGTIDFIFGNGATVIQRSTILVRMPLPTQFNAVTAQGRTGPSMPTGLVLQDCAFVADPGLDKAKIQTFLGRPWKTYARTVFLENDFADLVTPDGYRPFEGTGNSEQSYYGEYGNIGPSATTKARVKWKGVKVLTKQEAQDYTVGAFLPGAERWLNAAPVPFYLGFNKP